MSMNGVKVGFAMCGSFCTFSKAIEQLAALRNEGAQILPIMSEIAYNTDTRFGTAQSFRAKICDICGITENEIINSIVKAEPIGPKKLLDLLIIEPCTGNTLAKLANGIADSSVTLAAKAHLRNDRPILIAVSSNDGLAAAAKNIGALENRKNFYFVPYSQDDCLNKPTSLVADFSKTVLAAKLALQNKQLQPII